jgi:glycosyltransferase involved in cell wall biosynthesis
MSALFGCVDVMVHASTGEGFPLAMQEAMASGIPLAVLWDAGYSGSLDRSVVAACDSLAELGNEVRALAMDGARRAQLARAGREWTERKWSWEATVSAYETLYATVTHARRAATGVQQRVVAWES